MDTDLDLFLTELHAFGVAHDDSKADRLDRLRNLEPASAQLLGVLARVAHARRVLELGTSNGYSTLWLADAMRATEGALVSVEIDPARSHQAAINVHRAGLEAVVELRVGDAADVLAGSATAEWDMIFLDAGRSAYTACWRLAGRGRRRAFQFGQLTPPTPARVGAWGGGVYRSSQHERATTPTSRGRLQRP